MSYRIQAVFLLLAVGQLLHCLEEYHIRLWEVLAPTRLLISIVSSDLSTGFAVSNTVIIALVFGRFLSMP